ncbi:MAG: hypothetical protein AAB784_03085 [Patescibacteria group bacterium]|mgnify:CR=1
MSQKQTDWSVLLGILVPFVYFALTVFSLSNKAVAAYFCGSILTLAILSFIYQVHIKGLRGFLVFLSKPDKTE